MNDKNYSFPDLHVPGSPVNPKPQASMNQKSPINAPKPKSSLETSAFRAYRPRKVKNKSTRSINLASDSSQSRLADSLPEDQSAALFEAKHQHIQQQRNAYLLENRVSKLQREEERYKNKIQLGHMRIEKQLKAQQDIESMKDRHRTSDMDNDFVRQERLAEAKQRRMLHQEILKQNQANLYKDKFSRSSYIKQLKEEDANERERKDLEYYLTVSSKTKLVKEYEQAHKEKMQEHVMSKAAERKQRYLHKIQEEQALRDKEDERIAKLEQREQKLLDRIRVSQQDLGQLSAKGKKSKRYETL